MIVMHFHIPKIIHKQQYGIFSNSNNISTFRGGKGLKTCFTHWQAAIQELFKPTHNIHYHRDKSKNIRKTHRYMTLKTDNYCHAFSYIKDNPQTII